MLLVFLAIAALGCFACAGVGYRCERQRRGIAGLAQSVREAAAYLREIKNALEG